MLIVIQFKQISKTAYKLGKHKRVPSVRITTWSRIIETAYMT